MKKVLGIVILFFMTQVYAGTAAEDLDVLLQQMQSIQAHFTQKLLADKKLLQSSAGEMQIQKPNKFRWQIVTPNPQLIVGNGKKLWIYDKDLAQVTIKAMQDNLEKTPAALLSGSDEVLAKNYSVAKQDDWFILTPKTKDSDYQSIKIQFKNHTLQAMLLKDKLGQMSQLEFTDVQVNIELNNQLFQFKPPKGVDVIE